MFDGHIHYSADLQPERLIGVFRENHYDAAALLCIPKGMQRNTEQDVFDFKKQCEAAGVPTRIYVFGGLDHRVFGTASADDLAKALPERVGHLMELGCTGVKILAGKPNVRKDWGIPGFDTPVWEPFWQLLEAERIPVIMHVNDPETFWGDDPTASPEEIAFRRSCGWLYDGSFVNNEVQYAEVLHVVERHPRLKILFPHFFFLSCQLPRFASILERFPNVMTDLTPGVEMFYNLSAQGDAAAEFFDRWQDRICYGTDIGSRQVVESGPLPLNLAESEARISLVRDFLTAEEDHLLVPNAYYHGDKTHVIHPLHLSAAAQEKIFDTNFRRFIQKA